MTVLPQIVMSEMIESGKGCSFSDIAGQVQAKQALQECVILPSLRWAHYTLHRYYRVSHIIGPTSFFATLSASTIPKYKKWVSIKKFRKFAIR